MTRPLRIEFAGALYHVTSRGDHREAIYRDDRDRLAWLEIMAMVCRRFNFVIHAYCQMTNHYHLLVETTDGNLSQGMRQLNGVYTQWYNRRHSVAGHLFQGRYKAILVQKESHLLELSRYLVLNPLRAGTVRALADWRWSSYHQMIGLAEPPDWLEVAWLLSQFSPRRSEAIHLYKQFVLEGLGKASPLKAVGHQLFLGDADFTRLHRAMLQNDSSRNVSRTQRRLLALPLEEYKRQFPQRDQAIANACFSTAYTMAQVAEFFGVSQRTVHRAVKKMADCRN